LKELREKEIDTLVLGCTHYPILADIIQEVVGKDVKLIDSGVASSEIVKNEIARIGLETNSAVPGQASFYVSDIPTTFKQVAELFLGQPVNEVIKIDLEIIKSS
jgi:glutamate racemase